MTRTMKTESDKENIDSSTSNIGVEMQWIRSLWIWETNTFSESNLQLWKIVLQSFMQ